MTALTTAALPGQAGQMGLAQSQRAQQDVQEQSRQIDALKRDLQPVKDKSKKLREACEGFESVFIQKMWEQMRATVPKGGMLQGRDEQYWQGMFDQELSKKMSSAGGIGLADMMYEQLSRNLVSASRTTASGLGAAQKAAMDNSPADTGFVVSAAPLLPPTQTQSTDKADTGDKKGMYHAEAPQPEAEEHGASSQNADGMSGVTAQTSPGQQPAASVASASVALGALGALGASAASAMSGASATPDPAARPAASAATTAAQGAAGSPPPPAAPPEVQQVLEQLRAQAGLGGVGTTMTGAQAIAAVQAMTPMQALALSQGKTWAEVQSMGPAGAAMQSGLPAGMGNIPTGLDAARAAVQTANTRMPAGGVLPPMSPVQRQGQMHYSAAKVAGSGGSSLSRSGTPPAAPGTTQSAAPGSTPPTAPAGTPPTASENTAPPQSASHAPVIASSTMPLNPNLSSNVQGNPGVRPSHFVQNSPLIPPANMTAQAQAAPNAPESPLSMTAEQIAALSNQPAQGVQSANPLVSPAQAGQVQNAAAAQPAIPPTAQEPQIVNTTFTTNIPPKRRNGRQGQRVAKGQATIRSLNAG